MNSFKLSLYQLKKDPIDSRTWIKFTPIFIAVRGDKVYPQRIAGDTIVKCYTRPLRIWSKYIRG